MAAGGVNAPLGHVWLIGAGPGDPSLLTVAGLAALRAADVVVFDRLAPAELLTEARADAELVNAGKAAREHRLTQDQITELLIERGRAGRRVARLKGGDPFVFGRGSEEAEALAAAGVPCTVIPGVTSAIGGLAVAGIPVTHRGLAASFAVITGHEDPTKAETQVDWPRLANAADTLVVLMGVERLESITEAMRDAGRRASTPAALVQSAATPHQRAVTGTLADIAERAREAGIRPPALLVVGEVATLEPSLRPALLAPLAGRRVLVTRSRAQASTLVDRLRLEGARPLVLPAIETQRRIDAAAFEAALATLRAGGYRWLAFTSANAVEVFIEALWEQADLRLLGGTLLAAIGDGTVDALRRAGLRADLIAEDAVGEGLAQSLLAERGERAVAGARVLLPRAEGARSVLPDALREAGTSVDELTLYLSAAPAEPPLDVVQAVRAGEVDIATFTSSSTVRNLAAVLGGDLSPLASSLVACIGPITAETAREHGLEPAVVAEEHSVDGLVDALRRHLWRSATRA